MIYCTNSFYSIFLLQVETNSTSRDMVINRMRILEGTRGTCVRRMEFLQYTVRPNRSAKLMRYVSLSADLRYTALTTLHKPYTELLSVHWIVATTRCDLRNLCRVTHDCMLVHSSNFGCLPQWRIRQDL